MIISSRRAFDIQVFDLADLKEPRLYANQPQDLLEKGGLNMGFINKWYKRNVFFAPDGAGAGDSSSTSQQGSDTSSTDQNAGDQTQQQSQNSGATFSQEDLNRVGAREKANGKKSILKELGFNDEKSAKEAMTKYNEWLASQKTEAEKTQEKLTAAANAQTAAEARATLAENKVEIMKAGGKASSVDDIMAMISVRVDDKTDFTTALETVKKAYPSFFTADGSGDTGTGGGLNRQNNNKGNTAQGIGARLAQNRAKSTGKNPYFNN